MAHDGETLVRHDEASSGTTRLGPTRQARRDAWQWHDLARRGNGAETQARDVARRSIGFAGLARVRVKAGKASHAEAWQEVRHGQRRMRRGLWRGGAETAGVARRVANGLGCGMDWLDLELQAWRGLAWQAYLVSMAADTPTRSREPCRSYRLPTCAQPCASR